MKNLLTIIIPFLNEGDEIEKTVASIRSTAADKVDIMLVNDCSTDHEPDYYRATATKYNAVYYFNEQRQGVAKSRDIGVEMCTTPYFLLLDGHMRVYGDRWYTAITDELGKNDRAVYCLQCQPLKNDESLETERIPRGAYINFEGEPYKLLEPVWKYNETHPGRPIVKIPCILGACYALSKRYWNYIKGLNGLQTYGSDEPFLSLKIQLEGGECLLMKEIIVGHKYREKHPFPVDWHDRIYNRLLTAELLLPIDYKKKIFGDLHKAYGKDTEKALKMLISNKDFIARSKEYFKQIFSRDFQSFVGFNYEHIQ